ncbi:hypothetical protein RCH09_002216 [Actimicrobium sp. GrIS 1.19]|uniref:hypothetical protein n=1 Tax=Actimicrobium sp. GrIS 1.19 TaxID=3071708 RepID=UPI002E039408|nr:hypothetical protein [Actimicrobium sp. GrIS 1.19]
MAYEFRSEPHRSNFSINYTDAQAEFYSILKKHARSLLLRLPDFPVIAGRRPIAPHQSWRQEELMSNMNVSLSQHFYQKLT